MTTTEAPTILPRLARLRDSAQRRAKAALATTATSLREAPARVAPARPTSSRASSAPEIGDYYPEQRIEALCLGSVLKLAVCFAVTTLLVMGAALTFVWLAATATGVTHDIERFARSIGLKGFHLYSTPVFLFLALAAAAWVTAVTVLTLVAAAGFNLFCALFGGLRVTIVPADEPEPAPALDDGSDPELVAIPTVPTLTPVSD
jgi:hypothetical protein